jgi:hypothetical protein
MPFHINQLPVVNGNVLYMFTEYDKYRGLVKTSSNTPQRHIITYHVQFNGALVQQHYRKTESRPVCMCFLHTEIPLAHWKCHIEEVCFINSPLKQFTFKKHNFYQRKLHVNCNYSQAVFRFPVLSHAFIRISIVTTIKVLQTTCFFCQVN